MESIRSEGARLADGAMTDEIVPAVWEGIGMSLAEKGRLAEIPEVARDMSEKIYPRFLDGAFRYPEMVFAPILRAQGLPGVAMFLSRFEERGQRIARDRWAFHRAMLLVHATSPGAGQDSRPRYAAEALERGMAAVPREVAEQALGRALYRGQQLDGTPRFWSPPDKMRTSDGSGSLASSKAFWEGVAGAFQEDLALRSSPRLLVRASAPAGTEPAAASDVTRFLRGVPSGMTGLFRVHAGSKEAAVDPSRPSGYRAPSGSTTDRPTGPSPAGMDTPQP